MLESATLFSELVDDLIRFAEHDRELADGIRWLDGQAQKRGISFYDMVFEVLYNHNADSEAKKWLDHRN